MRQANIHVAVDLAGHTRNARLGVFRQRVAPVQVNYLGFPGTIGGAWAGALVYRRLGDRGFQQAVMALLLVSGLALIWTSW